MITWREDSGLPFSKPKNRFFQNWKDNIHLICQDSYFLVIYLFKLGYFKQSYFFRSCPLYRQIYLAWWVIPFLGKIVCIREIQYEIHSFANCLGETHYEIYYILQNRVCVYACLPGLRKTQHEIHSLAKLCVWLYVCVCLAWGRHIMKYTILQNRVCVYACLPSLREIQTQPPSPWSAIGQRVKQTHEH